MIGQSKIPIITVLIPTMIIHIINLNIIMRSDQHHHVLL